MTDYSTPLRRARGLGSAKRGVGHFIGQRVSAVALLLLAPWILWSGYRLAGGGFEAAQAWLGRPTHAVLLILTILAGLYHGQLGLRVVVEDYVEGELPRAALLILNVFVAAAVAALAVVCILGVSLTNGTV
jgi:succinate dehydrogenase / fumarate reductase membrane anchor subunit